MSASASGLSELELMEKKRYVKYFDANVNKKRNAGISMNMFVIFIINTGQQVQYNQQNILYFFMISVTHS